MPMRSRYASLVNNSPLRRSSEGWRLRSVVEAVVDWARATADVVARLQRLIQFKTVNPPGDEHPLVAYLHATLTNAGIDATIIETAANRSALVATIKGAGTHRPVMLVAHADVVDVEADRWSVDPFGGVLRDGYVYGRGAIDDKGMLAVHLETMLLLQREAELSGVPFARDIVLLVTPDEEAGGEWGMGWLAAHRPDLLHAEYAINEGGRIRVGPDGRRTLLLQTAEKVSHIVTFTARGHAGHAGVPTADNAILRVGRALARVSDYAADPMHGVSATILQGGTKYNVIPGEASVLFNVRTRPQESIDAVVATLRTLVDDPEVAVELVERGEGAPDSPEGTLMYRALADSARALDPTLTITPYLSNGITDSARLRRAGIHAYGILPFPLSAEDEGRMHGHDERVPVESLAFGLRLIVGAVRMVATG
jgi:acetylornithine deacetylase/succinyl-diaminopimelate desuccinylase-like protein